MKELIDIPKRAYDMTKEMGNVIDADNEVVAEAIRNGTPIPDNATNGEVIKAMFHDAEIHLDGNDVFFHHMGFWIKYNIRWWNAPYQKGGANENKI